MPRTAGNLKCRAQIADCEGRAQGVGAGDREPAYCRMGQIERRSCGDQLVSLSKSTKGLDARHIGVVDQEGDVVGIAVNVHIRKRIRGQIVGYRQWRIDPLIVEKGYVRRRPRVGGIAVDDIAAAPIRRRVYFNRQIPGRVDFNGLAAEIQLSGRICRVVERNALKPGEGRQLVNAERAAADQRQNIRPRAAGQAVTRVQRRRRRIYRRAG